MPTNKDLGRPISLINYVNIIVKFGSYLTTVCVLGVSMGLDLCGMANTVDINGPNIHARMTILFLHFFFK